jgi:hypothetical protein
MHSEVQLLEVRLDPGGLAGTVSCPPGLRLEAGRYFMVNRLQGDILPAALFACELVDDRLSFAPPLPGGWQNGDRLVLRGPFGQGFRLPAQVHRVAVAALGGSPARLMPLVKQALLQADVSIYCDAVPAGLPEVVEVLPLFALPDVFAWADYLALDLPLDRLPGLGGLLRLQPEWVLPCPVEALLQVDMPCGGMAQCGVCAVKTRKKGWVRICEDGPVFDLNELELV